MYSLSGLLKILHSFGSFICIKSMHCRSLKKDTYVYYNTSLFREISKLVLFQGYPRVFIQHVALVTEHTHQNT